jgi:hypothetical protein
MTDPRFEPGSPHVMVGFYSVTLTDLPWEDIDTIKIAAINLPFFLQLLSQITKLQKRNETKFFKRTILGKHFFLNYLTLWTLFEATMLSNISEYFNSTVHYFFPISTVVFAQLDSKFK